MRALFGLIVIGMWLTSIALTLYGVVLAFSASIVLGFVSFIVSPAFLVFGTAKFFFAKDLAQMLVTWLSI